MSSNEDEVGETTALTGSVSSASKGELAIDEDALTASLVPNPPVVPDFNVVAREGEKCAKRALEEVEANVAGHVDCRAEEASDRDLFRRHHGRPGEKQWK